MMGRSNLILTTSPRSQTAGKHRKTANLAHRPQPLYGRKRHYHTVKERDSETGLYYYGARYLDSKTSRWISGDPAMADYIPSAPVDDEARKRNGNLPGMGGVFNYVNLHVYHYAGNNPMKYIDPDGETPKHASLKNAINLDFGRDYMGLAEANFKEGEYGWAAIMGLNAVFEATYDLVLAYTGASFIGTAISMLLPGSASLGDKAFGALSHAKEYGIQTYSNLRSAISGTGLQAHHLIDKRFSQLLKINPNKMAAVAVTAKEHQQFTNAWRSLIPYGSGTLNATKEQIIEAVKQIYKDYPALREAALKLLE